LQLKGRRDPLADCNRHLNGTFIDSSGSLGWGTMYSREDFKVAILSAVSNGRDHFVAEIPNYNKV